MLWKLTPRPRCSQVLTSISLEGWSPIMYALMDAVGPSVIAYFVVLLLVGSFFIVNLVVAVIYEVRDAREARCSHA